VQLLHKCTEEKELEAAVADMATHLSSGVIWLIKHCEREWMNCWEWKMCGRETGGKNVPEHGVCPAYPDHGKHCARITGTFCDGKVQGTYAIKITDCKICGFYKSNNYDHSYRIET
jgi:hypothetical protein